MFSTAAMPPYQIITVLKSRRTRLSINKIINTFQKTPLMRMNVCGHKPSVDKNYFFYCSSDKESNTRVGSKVFF